MEELVGEVTALGLAALLALVVYYMVTKLLIPKLNGAKDDALRPHEPYCLIGRYESRLSTLEANHTSLVQRLDAIDRRLEKGSEVMDRLAESLTIVRDDIRWMRSNRNKRSTDGDE